MGGALVVYCSFAYPTMLAMRSNRDEFSLIIPYVRFVRETKLHEPLILDTNVTIDGRIADLCAIWVFESRLIAPRFILDELQTPADSRDPKTRTRSSWTGYSETNCNARVKWIDDSRYGDDATRRSKRLAGRAAASCAAA
jgi:hypothetical protein